jgi:hypothetical protein
MEPHDALAELTDAALENAIGKLHNQRRDRCVALGRQFKKGPLEAVSDDLPADTVVVSKGELMWERAQRKNRKG